MGLTHLDNNNPPQDRSQAEDFFKAIFTKLAGGFLEIRAFPSNRDKPIQKFFPIPSELDKASAFATELKSQVFYGAAPRARQEGKAEDVAALVTLWVDGDAEKGALPWTVLTLTPIAVVDSGNPSGRNYHAYYALDIPLELKTEADPNKAKVYLDALCTTLRGDPKSCDIARILRVPGTYNTKDPSHPGLCRIVELNPDARYSVEQIREAITISLMLRHWERGQRQDLALSLAGYLAKCDVAQDEAETLLLSLLQMTGDEEPKMRLLALAASYEKLLKGQPVKGYTGVEQYLEKGELTALDSLWGGPKEQRNAYLYKDKLGWHLNMPKLVNDLLVEYSFKTMRDNEECLVYEGGVYAPFGEAVVKEECEKRVPIKFMSRYDVNEVIGHIKRKTYVERKEFNREKWILNLQNGLYDIRTGTLSPHTPEFLSTIRIPVTYDPTADCPRVKQFFSEVHSRDDIPVVEELFGYSLTPDYSIQRAFLFIGDGANGKSTELELLKHFLGKDNCANISLQAIESHRFAVASLFGKLANIYADIPSTSMRHVGLFKMLTGGDTIGAEKKFKDAFSFVNHARLIFSTNKPPKVNEDSLAFWRRWIILDFPNKFEGPQADTRVLQKLTTKEELSGLLNVALQGLKRLLSQHSYSYQPSPDEVATRYLKAADSVYAFVEDICEVDSDAWVSKDDLYDAFCAYCRDENIPLKGKEAFGRGLKNATNVRLTERRQRVEGKETRGWGGIGLKAGPGFHNRIGETSEAPDAKGSMKPCPICGSTDFWLRPDGQVVCNRCHPKPK